MAALVLKAYLKGTARELVEERDMSAREMSHAPIQVSDQQCATQKARHSLLR